MKPTHPARICDMRICVTTQSGLENLTKKNQVFKDMKTWRSDLLTDQIFY